MNADRMKIDRMNIVLNAEKATISFSPYELGLLLEAVDFMRCEVPCAALERLRIKIDAEIPEHKWNSKP